MLALIHVVLVALLLMHFMFVALIRAPASALPTQRQLRLLFTFQALEHRLRQQRIQAHELMLQEAQQEQEQRIQTMHELQERIPQLRAEKKQIEQRVGTALLQVASCHSNHRSCG